MSNKNEREDKAKHRCHSFGSIKGKREIREKIKWLKCVMFVKKMCYVCSFPCPHHLPIIPIKNSPQTPVLSSES